MQKIERVSTNLSLMGEGRPDLAAEALQKQIAKLNEDGWAVVGVVPLSYSPPLGGAPHRLLVTEVALLCTR